MNRRMKFKARINSEDMYFMNCLARNHATDNLSGLRKLALLTLEC